MTSRRFTSLLVGVATLALAAAAGAQGTLSTQGFGYPTGGMSARSLATGGAITEFDPLSSTNPASYRPKPSRNTSATSTAK